MRTRVAFFVMVAIVVGPVSVRSQCLDYVETLRAPFLGDPLSLIVSPDGKNLYVSTYNVLAPGPTIVSEGAVITFSRDIVTGALTPLLTEQFDNKNGVDGLDTPTSLAISPDGTTVYAAALNDNAVSVFGRDSGTGALSFVEAKFNGVDGVDGLGAAAGVTVSPDGRHVYVASGGFGGGWRRADAGPSDNAIATFSRNASTGALTFTGAAFDGMGGVTGLVGLGSVKVTSDGKHVYTAGASDVAVFSRDNATGTLTFLEANTEGFHGTYARGSVTISPDGANVYVTNGDAIIVFGRDAASGMLSLVEIQHSGLQIGSSFLMEAAISPDGGSLYVVDYNYHTVLIFSRDAAQQGRLSLQGSITEQKTGIGLYNVDTVAVSADGKSVYTGAPASDAIVQYSPGTDPSSCEGTIDHPRTPCDRLGWVWGFCPVHLIAGMVSIVPCPTSGCRWIDPPYAVGYDFTIRPATGSPNFGSVMLPNIGDGLYDLYLFDPAQQQFVFAQTLPGLEQHVFAGDGVDRFRILGIEPGLVDPADPFAFETEVGFSNANPATFTMKALVPCPTVPDAFPLDMKSVKEVVLDYRTTGPGAGDDAVKVTSALFSSPISFDPATSDDVHITLTDTGTGSTLFTATLAAASGRWSRPNPTKNVWKYKDASVPTAVGIKTAAIIEKPAGSGTYQLELTGEDATLNAGNQPVAALDVLVEITGSTVAVCADGGLRCQRKNTKDQCGQ